MAVRRLFFDTNVWADYAITERSNHEISSNLIIRCLDERREMIFSVASLCTLCYLLERDKVKLSDIRVILSAISEMGISVHTEKQVFNKAVKSKFTDLEDAILYFTAVSNECDAFITQNTKDFPKSLEIPVFTPEQMMKELDEAN